jgi:hypothetical protein
MWQPVPGDVLAITRGELCLQTLEHVGSSFMFGNRDE